jgi:hypothetical protein
MLQHNRSPGHSPLASSELWGQLGHLQVPYGTLRCEPHSRISDSDLHHQATVMHSTLRCESHATLAYGTLRCSPHSRTLPYAALQPPMLSLNV